VHVLGALLSIGGGHAVQGDGEINGGALETSLRGSVRVQLHKGKFIKWPRAETPTHFITMGFNTDLDEAARIAVREMIDYLVSERGLTRDDAYLLCSQAVNLRVTQLVDGVKAIHAMIRSRSSTRPASALMAGARNAVNQSRPAGAISASSRACVIIPRSPTITTCLSARRAWILSIWMASVRGSAEG
jgi:hypothetical protein